jgi:hypothetical protein
LVSLLLLRLHNEDAHLKTQYNGYFQVAIAGCLELRPLLTRIPPFGISEQAEGKEFEE